MPHKILLADDSITIQKVIGLTLSSEEFQLIVSDNGDEAYEKARTEKPELIIADTNMPGLNGYELCEKIRKDPRLKEVPIILLVGTYETFDSERAKRVGATDHITKPFESQQLTRKVRDLLKQPPRTTQPLPTTPATPVAEEGRSSPLETIELEELEPVDIEFTPTEPIERGVEQEAAQAKPPQAEEATPFTPPRTEELPTTTPVEEALPPTPDLDFSDLSAVLSDSPPSPLSPPSETKEVSWNLEEFESYLAKEVSTTPEEIQPSPPTETAVDLAFTETSTPTPKEAEELPTSLPPEPPSLIASPPQPELEEELPVISVSEELAGVEMVSEGGGSEPEPSPYPQTEPVQPVAEHRISPKPIIPPSPAPSPPPQVQPPEIVSQLEARVRELVAQRVSALLEEILPRAIDEAISTAVERTLKQAIEQWSKRS